MCGARIVRNYGRVPTRGMGRGDTAARMTIANDALGGSFITPVSLHKWVSRETGCGSYV